MERQYIFIYKKSKATFFFHVGFVHMGIIHGGKSHLQPEVV